VSFIKSRLRRIETASRKGSGGACPECTLRPEDKGYIVVDGKDPAPEMPEVCPKCGRNTRLHIVVVYDEPGADFIEAGGGA
jgi:hypothetical protein